LVAAPMVAAGLILVPAGRSVGGCSKRYANWPYGIESGILSNNSQSVGRHNNQPAFAVPHSWHLSIGGEA